ncbi:MAG: PilZ domain-containing protein [Pseudobacteriovorax sp.]|nr:PilZ domain-containing protein [Pseudobacteriovorax sp.]
MGFNTHRPESLMTDLKRISIEFNQEGQIDERQLIAQYVEQMIYSDGSENCQIDDWKVMSTVSESTRQFPRIKFTNCYINAITLKASNNKIVRVRCELIDLSAGGACIAIPAHIKVMRRRKVDQIFGEEIPNIKLKFDFMSDIIVKGVIRSLKKPKLDPQLDIDNYDFDYTLPQYWKVNG